MRPGALVALLAGLGAALVVGFLMVRGPGPAPGTAPVPAADSGPGFEAEPTAVSSMDRLDNDAVRVVENRYEPGSESELHTHPDPRVVYVLAGGTLRLVGEDGSETDVELEPGMTLWRPAETHTIRNIGSTTVRLLEMEVRGAGY